MSPHAQPSRPRRPTSDLVAQLGRLEPRDRQLLEWLADHQVLTTPQITTALFSSTRACQQRLKTLHTTGFLDRFRWRRPGSGSLPWHWTLGPLGHALHAAAHAQHPPTPRQLRDRLERLAANPRLQHLLGVNQFFIDLAAHARTHPDTSLDRWWPEHHTAARFLGIRPDGHGLWTATGATVGFFLEYDTGTENLARVVRKLDAYDKLARAGGPTYPVLIRLPNRNRETHLHHHLTHRPSALVPVATSLHDDHPADPVWAHVGATTRGRISLIDLPSDHGPDTPHNPTWTEGTLIVTLLRG